MVVLTQPFHMIIYSTLVSIPMNMVSAGTGGASTFSNVFEIVYALGAMSFIRPAEKYIRELFGFHQGLANMASFDSGKQTIDAAEDKIKGVVDKIRKALEVVAIVATAGAATPAVAAAESATTIATAGTETEVATETLTGDDPSFIGETNPDNLLADDPGIYDGFSRDPFHEDYYSGDEFFDNDLQNEPPSEPKKMDEEELQNLLDGYGWDSDDEDRAELERELRKEGHGDPKYNDSANNESEDISEVDEKNSAVLNSGAEAFAFNNKMSETELQDELDRLGLDKGSEERAEMEEKLRAAGHGDSVGEIGDNIYDEELENYTPASNDAVKYNDGDTRMDELLEDISDYDENDSSDNDKNIKANTVKIEAGNVDMQKNDKNKDLENNVVSDNIKTADEQEEADEEQNIDDNTSDNVDDDEQNINNDTEGNVSADTKENGDQTSEKSINASSVIINAGNVNMQGDISQGATDDKIKTIEEQNENSENAEQSDGNESDEEKKKKENEGKIEIENEGTPVREKDGFITRRKKERKVFWNAATGNAGISDSIKNLSEDSLLGKVGQRALKSKPGQFLEAFEKVGGLQELHGGFNAVRDTFYANGSAPGDWKKTNDRMGKRLKEDEEQREYNFVNNEGNKQYMYNIMYEKHEEKLRAQNPNKSEAWIQNEIKKMADSKLESLSKTYVPLGIGDIQIAYECEEDRKKYGWTAGEAVEQRIKYEKFNNNAINVETVNKYLETNNSTIQESIPNARDYYNNGYTNSKEVARAYELTELLGVTTEYGMKLDKAMKNKGSQVNLNLDNRNDLNDKQKERIGKIMDSYSSSDKE